MTTSQYCVYIMTDEQHSMLYTGRTGNLRHRVAAHRSGNGGVTTRRHGLNKLVYYETVEDETAARQRRNSLSAARKRSA